jgi:hypothetical protein
LYSQDKIKYVWSCDGASRNVPLQGAPNHVGLLEIPGGLWEGGLTYTITMAAIWPLGTSTETRLTFRAAEGPHGGSCVLSAVTGIALVDRFSIDCPLWTPSDPVPLPHRPHYPCCLWNLFSWSCITNRLTWHKLMQL